MKTLVEIMDFQVYKILPTYVFEVILIVKDLEFVVQHPWSVLRSQLISFLHRQFSIEQFSINMDK